MRIKILLINFVVLLCGASCSLKDSNSEICFIGDSITYLWDLEYYFPGYYIHKHAVSGAKIQDVDSWDVSDCRGMPIVFLMGTNNIGNISVLEKNAEKQRQQFKEMFLKRVVSFGADPLWVISILPRNYGKKTQLEINRNIELQNKLIKNSLDSLGSAYQFIDVFDYFLEGEYQIDSTLFNDGLHPSEKGYEILTAKVQERI